MKLIDEWRILLKTPGPSRTAALLWLGTWTTAAVWGWFFVEPTVMRDSQAAREWVNFTIKLFPWLDNIKKLGPGTEKTTFLHATFTLLLAPVTDAAARRYREAPHQLALTDWNSGDQVWLIDILAPFGGAQEVLKDLREKVFPGQVLHQLVPTSPSEAEVMDWPAVGVVPKGAAGPRI